MQVILDKRFGKRYFVRNIMKMIPLLIGFIFLWRDWGRFELEFWLGIASFVGGIFYWAWQDRVLLQSYHCPRCGRHVPKPTIQHRTEGDPILLRSVRCGVGHRFAGVRPNLSLQRTLANSRR